jgi:hypothetical protein
MGLIDTIFSSKAKPLTVEQATANLETLRRKRAETTAAIVEATERRKALLQRDEGDGEVETVDRELSRYELKLERLDLAEPVALAALTESRAKARAAEWRRLAKVRFAADSKYAAAMRAAIDALVELVAIPDRIHNGGYAAEAMIFAIPPRILTPEAVAQFERPQERNRRRRLCPSSRSMPRRRLPRRRPNRRASVWRRSRRRLIVRAAPLSS